MEPLDLLKANLAQVKETIASSCRRAGRPEHSVTLVVVTKSVTAQALRLLAELGVGHVGESRVQDAVSKAGELHDCRFTWHMVGHLQRNKVRMALDLFQLIHSLDSPRLADEIAKEAEERDQSVRVLMEVNISQEEPKFGIQPDAVIHLAEHMSSLSKLSLEGLMTMAPMVDNPEDTRPYFNALRNLKDQLNGKANLRRPLTILSMGMSQDFQVAVEEGATIVRIGSAILKGLPQQYLAA